MTAFDDAEYDDIQLYNILRWLSQGTVLEIFVALLLFHSHRGISPTKSFDRWKILIFELALRCDISRHFKKLHLLLEGSQFAGNIERFQQLPVARSSIYTESDLLVRQGAFRRQSLELFGSTWMRE